MVTGLGTRDAERLALAATSAPISPSTSPTTDPVRALHDATGGLADVVVDVTAKAPAALAQALALARPGGTVVVAGTRGSADTPGFAPDLIVYKELRMLGALGVDTPAYRAALDLLATAPTRSPTCPVGSPASTASRRCSRRWRARATPRRCTAWSRRFDDDAAPIGRAARDSRRAHEAIRRRRSRARARARERGGGRGVPPAHRGRRRRGRRSNGGRSPSVTRTRLRSSSASTCGGSTPRYGVSCSRRALPKPRPTCSTSTASGCTTTRR